MKREWRPGGTKRKGTGYLITVSSIIFMVIHNTAMNFATEILSLIYVDQKNRNNAGVNFMSFTHYFETIPFNLIIYL